MDRPQPRTRRVGVASLLALLAYTLVVAACGGAASAPAASEAAAVPPPTPAPGGPVAASEAPVISSSASTAPSIALPTEWATFTSERFAYAIDHPADWTETPAAADWPETGWPAPDSNAADRFEVPGAAPGQVTVSSDVLAADEVAAGRLAEIDQETALVCQVSGITPVTIDGAEGRQNEQLCFGRDHVIEAFVDHADRIYLIYWFSPAAIPDTDRAIFAEMLKRFTFAD